MHRATRRESLGIWLAALILVVTLSPQFRAFSSIPREIRVLEGQDCEMDLGLPVDLYVKADKDGIVRLAGMVQKKGAWEIVSRRPLLLQPVSQGQVELEFRLFGVIPLRRMQVMVMPQMTVMPGGHSIGVLLRSEGLMVVRLANITSSSGHVMCPAREAGVAVGDTIVEVDGQTVVSDTQLASLVQEAGANGRPLVLRVKRGYKYFRAEVDPVLCRDSGEYRLGLWVRDSTAGVGTLSFYDNSTGDFMALGHIITDGDTRRPIEVRDGKIVMASVSGIEPGRRGQPGEKIGVFMTQQEILGDIEKNTAFGISGKLRIMPESPFFEEPVPVALANQAKVGPAEIITVVEGNRLENFRVEILKVQPQNRPEGKGILLKVTDPRLLKETGGIVQGMSGSPIIQEGMLIGAITHVLVNDPERGYGVFAEWMINEAGLGKPLSKATVVETPLASLFFAPECVYWSGHLNTTV